MNAAGSQVNAISKGVGTGVSNPYDLAPVGYLTQVADWPSQ